MSSYIRKAETWKASLEDSPISETSEEYQEALALIRDVEELHEGVPDYDLEKDMREVLDPVGIGQVVQGSDPVDDSDYMFPTEEHREEIESGDEEGYLRLTLDNMADFIVSKGGWAGFVQAVESGVRDELFRGVRVIYSNMLDALKDVFYERNIMWSTSEKSFVDWRNLSSDDVGEIRLYVDFLDMADVN